MVIGLARKRFFKLGVFLIAGISGSAGAYADQLVFGSFASRENASQWAQEVGSRLGIEVSVETVLRADGERFFRALTEPLSAAELARLRTLATETALPVWRLRGGASGVAAVADAQPTGTQSPADVRTERVSAAAETSNTQQHTAQQPWTTPSQPTTAEASPSTGSYSTGAHETEVRTEVEWDVALQSRWFAEQGVIGQDRVQGGLSVAPEFYRSWDSDRQSLTFAPFLRLDSLDDERSHFDVRELFYSYVGETWEFHAGARRIFWGVTEFNHLVDIINQTDLVENIDTEDKLGQPMLQYTQLLDWGTLDVFVLGGFRERTFPSVDGRLNLPVQILDDARYESAAEQLRTDFAVRWSQQMGALEFGLHHFSGTSRDPIFELVNLEVPALVPFYPVIDQTGLDAQLNQGDWAFKLEAFTRSGFGDRYAAANLGVERTLVGVLNSNIDFGIVAEYMFDERGDEAFNTLFENDIALGGRFALNDFADTQALVGVIVDAERSEYVWSVEASRQLGSAWQLSVEGRVFQGGQDSGQASLLQLLSDPDFKSAWLQQEDYLQIEFTRFF